MRFPLLVVYVVLLAATVPRARGDVYLFDLGTDDSALRPGFTRVTPATAFSEQRGFGWTSAEGITASHKAWSEPMENRSRGTSEPPPIYTNELTEDTLIGEKESEFVATVRPGPYRVYLLCGVSNGHRNQLFDFTVGTGKAEARILVEGPYRYEKRVLEAACPDGRLSLRFVPRSRWLVSAILVWSPEEEARVQREIIAPLEQEVYLLPPAEWEKWKEEPHVDNVPMPAFAEAERARGYVVHHRHYLEPVWPNTVPLAHAIDPELRAFASLGEYEPITFTVYPLKPFRACTVQVSNLTKGRDVIPSAAVDVRQVRYMLCRPNYTVLHVYRRNPDVLEHFDALDLEPNVNQRFWLTVHVPDDAAPGTYTGRVAFKPADAPPAQSPVTLRVLPIRLQEDPDTIYGIYYRHPYDSMSGAPDDVSREHFREKAELEAEDMVAHGTRNVTLDAWSPPERDGKFDFNLDRLQAKFDLWNKHGFRGPVVMAINTEGVYHKYMNEGYGSHMRDVKDPPQEFCDEMTRMVAALEAERNRRGWPEFLYYPVDEPSVAPESINFMSKVLQACRAAGVRTYLTADPTNEGFAPLKPYVDVWCTQPFLPDRDTVLKDSAARGVEYWCYPNHVNGENDHTPVPGARMTYGFGFWRSGFRTLIPWIYQWSVGNPFNYLDGSMMDFFNRSEPDGTPIPVAMWEAYREGYDDYRYVYTLQQLIEKARASNKPAAMKAADEAQKQLQFVWDSIQVQPKYKYDDLWAPEEFDVYRWIIASEILKLQ